MKAFQPRLLVAVLLIIVALVALQNRYVHIPQNLPSSDGQAALTGRPVAQAGLLDANTRFDRIVAGNFAIPTAEAPRLTDPTALPFTKEPTQVIDAAGGRVWVQTPVPGLASFIQSVTNGQAAMVRGLFIPGVLALRVVQQPDSDASFVSLEDGTATQFQSASPFGVIGLLAHNFLSGRLFFQIATGQELSVVYGDGSVRKFQVVRVNDFERLSKNDLYSDFRALDSNETLSADEVFKRFYEGQPHLTLQTCVEKNGDYNWGVRFIIATPIF